MQTFKYSGTSASLGFLLLLVLLFLFSASDLLWGVYIKVVYHLEASGFGSENAFNFTLYCIY